MHIHMPLQRLTVMAHSTEVSAHSPSKYKIKSAGLGEQELSIPLLYILTGVMLCPSL